MPYFSTPFNIRLHLFGNLVEQLGIMGHLNPPLSSRRHQNLSDSSKRVPTRWMVPIIRCPREKTKRADDDGNERRPEPEPPAHLILNVNQEDPREKGFDVRCLVEPVEEGRFPRPLVRIFVVELVGSQRGHRRLKDTGSKVDDVEGDEQESLLAEGRVRAI